VGSLLPHRVRQVPVTDVTPRESEGQPIVLADFDASNVSDVVGVSASNRQKAVDRQLEGGIPLQPRLKFLSDEIDHDEAMRSARHPRQVEHLKGGTC